MGGQANWKVVAVAVLLAPAVGCAPSSILPEEKPAGGGAVRATTTGGLVKEGWFGLSGFPARLEVQRVERHADRSVLRFFVTSLKEEPDTPQFGTSPAGLSNFHFRLVDPVRHKLYDVMYDESDSTVGSRARPSYPGVRYEAVLYFPPIPAGVETITVLSPGTAGEFTGVPVTEASGPPAPTAPPATGGTTPAPGGTLAWPVVQPQGRPRGAVFDLHSLVETETETTDSSLTDETVGLRTDVLFAFDSARLSGRAESLLDRIAGEIRREADPARPPVDVEGHTDGKGTHAYNVDLSRRRAEVVQREIQARLGDDYRYRASGKAETEPVAEEGGADDERARRRNRRVEISYRLRERAPGPSGPTRFRQDGGVVASRSADFEGPSRRRIDVRPFYRDGDYLVAVFEITNLGPASLNQQLFAGYGGNFGARFASFGVIDPASKITYRGVRAGPDQPVNVAEDYVEPRQVNYRSEPNTTNRGFLYVPAPPPNVTSVTFDAGPFGQIPDVPVR